MDVAVFSTKPYDRLFLDKAFAGKHRLIFHEARLTASTTILAGGAGAVCAFVNDRLDAEVLEALGTQGVRLVALRSAGYNNVDRDVARRMGIAVAHVPAYSPEAVSEHTVALILTLGRRIHRAYSRVREGNFALEGLLGFNLHGRTVGVIGTGQIGLGVARIMQSFGCRVIAHDPFPNPACLALGIAYLPLAEVLATSDIISLHCPLTPETYHLIRTETIAGMKRGVMVINTGRGGLIDTQAAIDGLKEGTIGFLGLDVYEEEAGLFFEDLSAQIIHDDVFERLLTFPNVLVTGHQGFFTVEALAAIAATTEANITSFERTGRADHQLE